jgi:hypothetical protein
MDSAADDSEAARADRSARLADASAAADGQPGNAAGTAAAAGPPRLQVVLDGVVTEATGTSLGALQNSGGWMSPDPGSPMDGSDFCDTTATTSPDSAPRPSTSALAVAAELAATLDKACLPASESDTTGYVVLVTLPHEPIGSGTSEAGRELSAEASVAACLKAMSVLPAPAAAVTAQSSDWSAVRAFCYDDECCDELEEGGDADAAKVIATTKLLGERLLGGFELNFSEACVCAPVLYGGWVPEALGAAECRLAFAKLLSDRLGEQSGFVVGLGLDLVEAVGTRVERPPRTIVAVLSMRVWT